ncbi:MAG TPA: polyprenyl synthetase family protein [Bacteroidales bacterium]|nr:polyprenyl synthetase family protein [Bacteroidales bacterium]HRZ48151.1 polyprenyl synthetase family protein [Bacteroidales bacterium]
MKSLDELHRLVGEKLQEEHFSGIPSTLYEPIAYIMSLGGKRLRPVLLLLAAQMYGRKPESVLDAAIGIEVFHNFTLMHDDIMDHAPMRRGRETVHTKWDVNTAILSGDTMMVLAYDLLLKTPTDHLTDVLGTFNQTAREVCEGQQYDMDFETSASVSIPEYMEMIRLKTSVLIAGALKMGAQIAGAPADEVELLYRFGEKIGLAFQLKDDLLDVFGDESRFGKKTGNDILTNKKTFLLISCLEAATPQDRGEIIRWMAKHDEPERKIQTITALFRKYSIDKLTDRAIEQLNSEGLEFLRQLHAGEAKLIPLHQMLESMKLRDL